MSGSLEKVAIASRIAIRHPTELIDRLVSRWEARHTGGDVQYFGAEWRPFLQQLAEIVGEDVLAAVEDPEVAKLEREVLGKIPTMGRAPFGPLPSADLLLAKTCYALCRAIKPACVVETGVAYGVSSSFFLAALEANGKGVLHSIDLPALSRKADDYVGSVIPDRLRTRWRLYRGSTRRVLPKLLPLIDPIDIFLHDSLHTYSGMSQDLRIVLSHLAGRAAVVVDDVELNTAFSEWESLAAPAFSAVVRSIQKRSLFGVAVFQADRALDAGPARAG